MLILSNTIAQTLSPGQAMTFNLIILKTGNAECFRLNSGSIGLRCKNAIYEVSLGTDIGATEEGTAQLAINLNGSTLNETIMTSQTAAAGDLNNVSKRTAIPTCCCAPETVTVVNIGTTTVNIDNPLLFVKRVA